MATRVFEVLVLIVPGSFSKINAVVDPVCTQTQTALMYGFERITSI